LWLARAVYTTAVPDRILSAGIAIDPIFFSVASPVSL
jgi:hypothetical protein